MARPDGALVTGQRLTLMFAGAAERQAQVAALVEAVGFEAHWVGHVRYARNLEALAGAGAGWAGGCGCQPCCRLGWAALQHDAGWWAAVGLALRAPPCPCSPPTITPTELYISLGAGLGGADWGAGDGSGPSTTKCCADTRERLRRLSACTL